MRIRSKEEVLELYKSRYPQLDRFFQKMLSAEYDKHYDILKDFQTPAQADSYFDEEIEKNEQMYKDNMQMEGIEAALNDQFMTVLANYGLIVFFRDNMIEE